MDINYVWVVRAAEYQVHVFKTKTLAVAWLKKEGMVFVKKDDCWRYKDEIKEGVVSEYDAYLDREKIITFIV